MDITAKINELMTNTAAWPQGTVSATSALNQRGYSDVLIDKYRRSGWLVSLGSGAVARHGDNVEWTGALYTLQKQLSLPVHVGGKTALQLHGHTHFVSAGSGPTAYLFCNPGTRLPAWFTRQSWKVRVEHLATNLFGLKHSLGLAEKSMGTFSVSIASRERAMLELLHLVPNAQGFEEAAELMQQLATLQPDLVTELLKTCRSIKVKRLFLFLADHCNHPWLAKIDRARITLGHGKRQIVKDGQWESKYSITVPKGFVEKPNEEAHA